jgi:predicted DNA-binding transcriptional regulator YafY
MSETLLRQWQMLKLLPRAPRKVDVPEMRNKLQAAGYRTTVRTIQRDLNMLSAVFPLRSDTRSTPYGWSWSADAPSFDLPVMDGTEALTLKLVERFIPTLLPPMVRDYLRPYFAKATEVLKRNPEGGTRRWIDNVRVVPREMPLLPPPPNPQASGVVYQALLEGRRFTADYLSRSSEEGVPKTFEISPLALVARGNLIYLVCTIWKYEDIRQLAVHRIHRPVLLEKRATRPATFNLDRYIEQGEFQYPVGPMIQLKAKFERDAAAHLYETPLSADQKIEDLDDNYVLVTATLRDTSQLEWWLLAFGDLAVVVGPPSLRLNIASSIRRADGQYNDAIR